MRVGLTVLLAIALLPLVAFAEGQSKEEPLWEVGLFAGYAQLPHYRGSDEYNSYVLPLPYIIYRGEVVRANRDGFNGVLLRTERFETALSFSGTPPVDSDNRARRGMPEVDAMFEVGPGAKLYVIDRDAVNRLYFRLGLRAATSVDTDHFDLKYRGLRGGLQLVYQDPVWLERQDLELGFTIGVDVADREYNGYLYDVDPAFATDARPAYEAETGYAGFSVAGSVVKDITPRWALASYFRWDNIAGAVYADSPLIETENNYIFGFAVICSLRESTRTSRYESE
jgi:MipA family protein